MYIRQLPFQKIKKPKHTHTGGEYEVFIQKHTTNFYSKVIVGFKEMVGASYTKHSH